MVRALSAALALDTQAACSSRPDLMPGDVTGSLVYDARTAGVLVPRGPVFTNLLLADEINRTPPKTQASLLEAMEERQVSVEGEPRPLPDPFIVVATQNPVEYEGTYPLPEAQLDRFLLKLTVPLPARDDEFRRAQRAPPRLRPARPAGGRGPAGRRRRPTSPPAGPRCARVQVAAEVLGYVVDLCRATRTSPSLSLGASPRGATALLATAKAWAWLSGRDYVTPDDVKALARPTLAAPDRGPARGRARGRDRGRRAGQRPRLGAGAPVSRQPDGHHRARRARRAALAALLALAPRRLGRCWPSPRCWRSVSPSTCALAGAGRATWRWSAIGATSTRLGQPVEVALTVANARAAAGPRRACATPGCRRPGPTPRTQRIDIPPGERRRLITHAAPDPARRPAAGTSPSGPSGRSGSPAGSGRHGLPLAVRVLPPFTSRKFLPEKLARLRELDGARRAEPARAGHGVRLAAGVRRRRRRPLHRLAGHRPARRRRRPHLAAGARPPAGLRARHRPHLRRPGRRRAAAGRRPRRLPAAGRGRRAGR